MIAVLPVKTPDQFVVWYEWRGEGGGGWIEEGSARANIRVMKNSET